MEFSDPGEDNSIVLPEFTTETAPVLEYLCIQIKDSMTLDSQTLTHLLKHTPLLRNLKLSGKVMTNDVFLQLGRKTEFSWLVPQLCRIDLRGSTFEFEDANSIIVGMVAF
ncbi:uncharacterized protein BT62DRAFT_935045 [Guyanagaster necrorhizus]|uniref:Uncharacterized protein n=1 Tax=Guyanagaster necrorhizus TaxID=856835 RepID=A0A9P7VMZ4_9AGAR|nr:uncharacterized protein BT62DRAFT_935045 [Guyanagaster necrorhizus MCA 3950]KAG7443427.1 hypothetical protein BT62DRAFT_935045 [Guyanagaster necrorhizus MCA 3950]